MKSPYCFINQKTNLIPKNRKDECYINVEQIYLASLYYNKIFDNLERLNQLRTK